MNPLLHIVLCDDDSQFAQNQIKELDRKIKTRFMYTDEAVTISSLSQVDQIKEKSKQENWDVIFCDLGWGDLTLEGIQILNTVKIEKPQVYTVLYTAQDENDAISQALQWQLDFIDQVIRIEDKDYFSKMLSAVHAVFNQKRDALLKLVDDEKVVGILEQFVDSSSDVDSAQLMKLSDSEIYNGYKVKDLFPECHFLAHHGKEVNQKTYDEVVEYIDEIIERLTVGEQQIPVHFKGLRLLDSESRSQFVQKMLPVLQDLQSQLPPLLTVDGEEKFAADISVSHRDICLKMKKNPVAQDMKKYNELIMNLKRYPRVEAHDLLPLNKTKFIEFIKETYGGFPQMADARGLDLNNIYRVNRRFKHLPVIVFKNETIQEIVGERDVDRQRTIVTGLLSSARQVSEIMRNG